MRSVAVLLVVILGFILVFDYLRGNRLVAPQPLTGQAVQQ
jgi:hypothetical protein